MKLIATYVSDFAGLIKQGGTYADKTAHFHQLVTEDFNQNR
jgi:hypothetical protein